MTQTQFSDDILMAYADGELDADTAKAVDIAVQADPDIADRVRLFVETGARLGALSVANPPEPVPDALMARISATLEAARTEQDSNVVAFAQKPDQPSRRWQPMALAASLALAAGFGAGFGLQTLGPGQDAARMAFDAAMPAAIETALNEVSTGETRQLQEGTFTAIASFFNDSDELCREFEFDGASGDTRVSVVCKDAGRWDTRLVVATGSRDGDTYAPASSFDTLDAYLGAIGAGAPLSPEDEASALRALAE